MNKALLAAAAMVVIAASAPGDAWYHGGHWAVYEVSWRRAPYLLKSESEILAAERVGDVVITRRPEHDFRCPLQF